MEFRPLILLLSTIAVIVSAQCPPPEAIYPCSCQSLKNDSTVLCKQLGTEVQLEKVLLALKGKSLTHLSISGLNASTLRPDHFDGLSVQSLTLDKIEVEGACFRPGRRNLLGLENSLEYLTVSRSFRNGHRPLVHAQLDHLTKLKHVIFEDNSIPEVDNNWFKDGPAGLTTLIFERNGIEQLGERAFSALKNLDLLAVAGNHIRELKRSMFPPAESGLRVIDLANNNLRELPESVFDGFPKLQEVNLENNLIHTLQLSSFTLRADGSTQVTMAGNPLVCNANISWTCNPYYHVVIEGKCVSPAELQGKTVNQFCQTQKK